MASTGPTLATGTWGWDVGGFGVDLPDGSIRFPIQELWPLSDDVPCGR